MQSLKQIFPLVESSYKITHENFNPPLHLHNSPIIKMNLHKSFFPIKLIRINYSKEKKQIFLIYVKKQPHELIRETISIPSKKWKKELLNFLIR